MAGERAESAKFRQHGEAVARGGEGLAHIAGVGLGLGEDENRERRRRAGGSVEERDVFRELLGEFGLVGDDEPSGGRMGADQLGQHGAAGRGADAGEALGRKGRSRG